MLYPYICNADEISKLAHSLLENRHPVPDEDFIKLVISTKGPGFTSSVSGGALTMAPTGKSLTGTGGCYLSMPSIRKASRLYSNNNRVWMVIDATVSGLPDASGGEGGSEPVHVTPFSVVYQDPNGKILSREPSGAGINQNGRYTFTAALSYRGTSDQLTCSVSGGDGNTATHTVRGDQYFAGVEFGHFGATTLYPSGGILSVHEYKIIATLANDYDPFDESVQCTSDRWFSMRPIDGNTWHFDGEYIHNGRPYPL